MFIAGDKVVCVDDSPGIVSGARDLKYGQTYVVENWGRGIITKEQTLFLVGIPVHIDPVYCWPVGWAAERFIHKEGSELKLAAERISKS